jgi:hypothetical protein
VRSQGTLSGNDSDSALSDNESTSRIPPGVSRFGVFGRFETLDHVQQRFVALLQK